VLEYEYVVLNDDRGLASTGIVGVLKHFRQDISSVRLAHGVSSVRY
jgi:hypothetical protein